jgi:hypothetical protein
MGKGCSQSRTKYVLLHHLSKNPKINAAKVACCADSKEIYGVGEKCNFLQSPPNKNRKIIGKVTFL